MRHTMKDYIDDMSLLLCVYISEIINNCIKRHDIYSYRHTYEIKGFCLYYCNNNFIFNILPCFKLLMNLILFHEYNNNLST